MSVCCHLFVCSIALCSVLQKLHKNDLRGRGQGADDMWFGVEGGGCRQYCWLALVCLLAPGSCLLCLLLCLLLSSCIHCIPHTSADGRGRGGGMLVFCRLASKSALG